MRIVFVDRSTKLAHVRELEKRARGGMVTSLFKVTDFLSSHGHDVTVLSDIESTGATRAGTKWLHEVWGSFDVLVCNRGVGNGYPEIDARSRVLWTHDLPHGGFIPEPSTMAAFARTVFMSRYAERVWRKYYLTIGKSVYIPNGVDKKIFYPRQKDKGYLIYASAPNRGLAKLDLIFDSIQARVKRDLRFNAFSNLQVLHPNEKTEDHNKVLSDGYGLPYDKKSIKIMDPLPQQQFADQIGKASLMIMPTPFPEICCNVILQAMVSGTPVITTGKIGSAGEWIKHKKNGMLTEFISNDYMVHIIEIVRDAVTVLNDGKLHQRMIDNAIRTKILNWDQVGVKWEKMLKRL